MEIFQVNEKVIDLVRYIQDGNDQEEEERGYLEIIDSEEENGPKSKIF